MRTINKKSLSGIFAVVLVSALWTVSGHAHDTWITMDSYTMEKSKPAQFTVANAHKFVIPGEGALAVDEVEKAFLAGPDTKEINVVTDQKERFRSSVPLEREGSYMAVIKKRGGFSSKTVDGFKKGKNKKDVKDVIECSYSEKYAKAIFSVGTPGGDGYSKTLGHGMEIIPLKDPAGLKKGDELPVKVLILGKPARTNIFGTYAGFSEESNTFAYTTATDKEGTAKIKIIKEGVWLLVAKQDFAYPDATVCDKQSYAATLTFKTK
jgi:uncharacterized GH25 family protein